ncbi:MULTISPECIES: alpha/beta hydrolase family esterase [Luteimonas]|uniref:alpha/beta hydrolase family esterase n=1 Tax=Luteimonas TaxID=83614 RepID=UPI000C795E62|nr:MULTISPECIES: polyhydroxybutyrate depolymerase [Luteimonas]
MRGSIRIAIGVSAVLACAAWGPAHAAPACDIGAAGQTRTVALPGGSRSMALHRPSGSVTGPLPLLVLLHGSGGTGAGILGHSALAGTADARGFIVVAPDAGIPLDQGFAWHVPGVPTVTGEIPGRDAADDVAYLQRVMRWLTDAGCANASRTYVAGLSGGGRMTSWLGCVASTRIAAIAPVVGLRAGNPLASNPARPDPATCRPRLPMPVIAFAGALDDTNPIGGGGASYWQYDMHAAQRRWAQLNRCTAAPTTEWAGTGTYVERYSGCRGNADVEAWVRVESGHSWVADNEALWDFVSRYRR